MTILILSEVTAGQNISTHQSTCPTQVEAMAFAKIIVDFVCFRKLDDFVVFDLFDTIKSGLKLGLNLIEFSFYLKYSTECSMTKFMFMKLQKVLTENLVKTQIISDPKLMPFDSVKRTGEFYSRNFSTLTIILQELH